MTSTPPAERTLVMLPTCQLVPNTRNVRRDVGDLTELAASIRARGIDTPLTVAPLAVTADADVRWVIVAGHRRHAAAVKLKLASVPAIIRADLTDPADQIIAMMSENAQREQLTAAEEAAAVQGMLDLGLTVGSISDSLGVSKTKVRARAKIAGLPQLVLDRIHANAVTLADAAFVADHPEHADTLEPALGTAQWAAAREAVARDIDRERWRATQVKDAAALGIGELPGNGGTTRDLNAGVREVTERIADADRVSLSDVRVRKVTFTRANAELADGETGFIGGTRFDHAVELYIFSVVRHDHTPDAPAPAAEPDADHDDVIVDPAPAAAPAAADGADRPAGRAPSTVAVPDDLVERIDAVLERREKFASATAVRRRFLSSVSNDVKLNAGRVIAFANELADEAGVILNSDRWDVDGDAVPDEYADDPDEWVRRHVRDERRRWWETTSPIDILWTLAVDTLIAAYDWRLALPRSTQSMSRLTAVETVEYCELLTSLGYVLSGIEQEVHDAAKAMLVEEFT